MLLSSDVYPVITLYQPWATWIMRGWKTIETRTHNRFACLRGKDTLIHAGQKTDAEAIRNPYLTRDQLIYKPEEMINGYILGLVHVYRAAKCDWTDSKDALIDCAETERYGLFLQLKTIFNKPIPVKGEIGIWYYDLSVKEKVKAPERFKNNQQEFLF